MNRMTFILLASLGMMLLSAAFFTLLLLVPRGGQPRLMTRGEVVVGETVFKVEVAKTGIEKTRGLSGRPGLKEREGMLFLYATPQRSSFWMKGMSFSLDFIWI